MRFLRQPWWFWVSLVPVFGFWAPIVPASQIRSFGWRLLAILPTLITVPGFVIGELLASERNDETNMTGVLLVLGWLAACGVAAAIRRPYRSQVESVFAQARDRAELELADDERARRLIAENPDVARRMGIGRATPGRSFAKGLVDINHASEHELLALPGIDAAAATTAVRVRERIGGFDSVDDFLGLVDVDGGQIDNLRRRAVCLPYET